MVHVPSATAVTRPELFTVAMLSSEEVQITFLSSVFFGSTVARITPLRPASSVISVLSSVISSALWVTRTLMLARTLLPSVAVATIRALPRSMPVTTPFSSTVATFSFWELQSMA